MGDTRIQVPVVWCPPPPGGGGKRHLVTVPSRGGGGGTVVPGGGGVTWSGWFHTIHQQVRLAGSELQRLLQDHYLGEPRDLKGPVVCQLQIVCPLILLVAQY